MERIKLTFKGIPVFEIFNAAAAFVVLIYIYRSDMLISNLIIVFGVYAIGKINKRKKDFLLERKDRIHVVILSIILSFALIGNYLFCYPLTKNTSLIDVILFLLFTCCIFPVAAALIRLEKDALKKDFFEEKRDVDKKHYIKMGLVYLFLTELVGVIMLLAFNPAIVSWDAYEVLAEAYGLSRLSEYTGLMYVGIFAVLLRICNSIMFLGIAQITLFALLFSRIFVWLEKRSNLRADILVIAYVLLLIFPGNMMMLATLTKDVYYSLGIIGLTFCLIRMYMKESQWSLYAEYAVWLFFVYEIRQSGMIVSIISAIAAAFLFKNRKIFISTIAAIGLVMAFSIAVRNCDYEETPSGLKYVALYQDLLGVYYSGGKVSKEVEEIVNIGVGDNPEFADQYTPYWAYYDEYVYHIGEIEMGDFLKGYIDTFLKNPGIMLRAIMCRMDMLWDIRLGKEGYESWQWKTLMINEEWSCLVPERNVNVLTNLIDRYGKTSLNEPIKSFVWRQGGWFIICVACFMSMWKRDRRSIVIYMPLAAFVFSYLVSLGWSHYRYYWSIELLAVVLCMAWWVDIKIKKKGSVSAG